MLTIWVSTISSLKNSKFQTDFVIEKSNIERTSIKYQLYEYKAEIGQTVLYKSCRGFHEQKDQSSTAGVTM